MDIGEVPAVKAARLVLQREFSLRVFFRLLALAVGVVTAVAVIQAINGSPWWVAIAWGVLALALSFISKLVPPNKTVQLAWVINHGGLAKESVATRVEQLLQSGANPNGIVQGARIINEATVWGETDVLRALLSHRADPNGRDLSGWTPVHVAQNNDRLDLVRLLVQNGADVNAADQDGRTPLHMAASRGAAETVRGLIRLGANVDAQDNQGKTPLAEAESTLSSWTSSSFLSQDRAAVSSFRETVTLLRTQGA